jgi:outer membrane receptor protein involved in Fe transport
VIRASVFAFLCVTPAIAFAQSSPQSPPPETTTYTVTVVGTTPLPGVGLPSDQVPAPVQTATDQDVERSGALALSDFMNRRLTSVHVSEVQNNPFQPDVSFRGYTASPLLGTPQGLSVYMDGVRLNQPFGDVVSWDLIPRMAIATTTLVPGSNPIFGLNTLGGALSLETKTGTSARGTTVQATYGSDARRLVEFEHGGARKSGTFNWYLAGSAFAEDGWRDDSPSSVRQLFGKVGWNGLTVSGAYANNSLTGNGLQDVQLLDRDYASIYTKPDTTDNRAALVSASFARNVTPHVSVLVNGYYRDLRTDTLNGDVNEDALGQPNTPFPSLQCVVSAATRDEPATACNGLITRAHDTQRNGGASGQITRRDMVGQGLNLLTVGAAVDHSAVAFTQLSELGYLNPDRSVTGVGAFADGATGGAIDGEPFDTQVDLTGTVTTWSVYATDTLPIGTHAHVTLSGRYNRSGTHNADQIHPAGAADSLTGDHVFQRFNPAAGLTIDVPHGLNVYANYSEGSRAATSIELGCANPDVPCKLPNAMAGDPPLDQVVTRTIEGGIRKPSGRLIWSAGLFGAINHDDIMFVTSGQAGFGYFRNVGETRRQGVELSAQAKVGRATIGASYTYLRATFGSAETLNGEGNSTNNEGPGLEGTIDVEPGDRLPLVPAHMFKAYGDLRVTSRLDLDVDLVATSSMYARGNENNAHQPDGVYYLGAGTTDAYAIVNLGARYAMTRWLQVIGQIDNLFDRKYTSAAQLGPTAFAADGTFAARPFPAMNGEFPLRHSTFFAPGAPIRGWVGVRTRF